MRRPPQPRHVRGDIQQIDQHQHYVTIRSGDATGAGANPRIVVPEKGQRDRRRQAASEEDSGVDRIVQAGALNHAFGNNARDGRSRLPRADCCQTAQRRNLLRHRMLEAEALEAPTESLERGNGGD